MTADINVILQLLQRQIAPVPPAYSTVSSGTLPTDSPGLYGTGNPVLHSMYPISPIQMDNLAPTQVWNHTYQDIRCYYCTRCFKLQPFSYLLPLQSSAHVDVQFGKKKSQESLSGGINVTVTPETDTNTDLAPQPSLVANSRMCSNLRYPSLPGNLDLASELTEIPKHLSDPALPAI